MVLAAEPLSGGTGVVVIGAQIVTDADLDALVRPTNCGGTDDAVRGPCGGAAEWRHGFVVIGAQIVTDADLDALDQAFATFNTTT